MRFKIFVILSWDNPISVLFLLRECHEVRNGGIDLFFVNLTEGKAIDAVFSYHPLNHL
jgi:hypothetical protein